MKPKNSPWRLNVKKGAMTEIVGPNGIPVAYVVTRWKNSTPNEVDIRNAKLMQQSHLMFQVIEEAAQTYKVVKANNRNSG